MTSLGDVDESRGWGTHYVVGTLITSKTWRDDALPMCLHPGSTLKGKQKATNKKSEATPSRENKSVLSLVLHVQTLELGEIDVCCLIHLTCAIL